MDECSGTSSDQQINTNNSVMNRECIIPQPQKSNLRVLSFKPPEKLMDLQEIRMLFMDNIKSKEIKEGLSSIEMVDDSDSGETFCFFQFLNPSVCSLALTELSDVKFDGSPLNIKLDVEKRYANHLRELKRVKTHEMFMQNAITATQEDFQSQLPNINSNDPVAYGLDIQYLHELGIELPLSKQIFVGRLNIKVTDSKLREIFSYAGQIARCAVVKNIYSANRFNMWAVIEYDHPLEAVQAISMFDGCELYKRAIKVKMYVHDLSREDIFPIPEGLKQFGPGLGMNGQPLTSVRLNIELLKIKELYSTFLSTVSNDSSQDEAKEIVETHTPKEMLPPPMHEQVNFAQIHRESSTHMLPLPMSVSQHANTSSFASNENAFNVQPNIYETNLVQPQSVGVSDIINTTDLSRFNQVSYDDQVYNSNRNSRDEDSNLESRRSDNTDRIRDQMENSGFLNPDYRINDSNDTVLFSNLPSNVSLRQLTTKVKDVGGLKFVEMSGRGRALARFIDDRHAARCIKYFKNCRVDGQSIYVDYF